MAEFDPWAAAGIPRPGSPQGPPGQAQPWTNNVQADPNLTENIDWIKERRSASNAQGQKQRAFGDIDQMLASRGKSIEANLAQRGISGSGVGIEAQSNAADEAARAKVRAGMDIDQAEQGRQDMLALGAAGIMQAPSRYALGQGQLNLGQMQAAQGQENWMAQFQAQQQNQAMNNYMQMLQMFQNQPTGSYGGGYSRGLG